MAGFLIFAFVQYGKLFENDVNVCLNSFSIFAGISAHQNVFHHGEFGEYFAPLRHIADAQPDDLLGIHAVDSFAHEFDGSFLRLVVIQQTHNGF